jgi:hypothetical protein
MRAVLGVIAGYLVWTVIWLGGNAVFFAGITKVVSAGQSYTAPGPLAAVIALSVVCSVAAGVVCAALVRDRARPAVLVMAVLLLITGVAVEVGYWALVPAWFIVTFWILIVPATMLGGRLIRRGA